MSLAKRYLLEWTKYNKGSWPIRGAAILSSTVLLLAVTTGLSDNGIFELDGNATTQGNLGTNGGVSHDWDQSTKIPCVQAPVVQTPIRGQRQYRLIMT